MRDVLIEFMDELREYVLESGTDIAHDERDSSEFVDIFLQGKLKEDDIPEYEYEMFIEAAEKTPFTENTWIPISTDRIKNPNNIDEYIKRGILRKVERVENPTNKSEELFPETEWDIIQSAPYGIQYKHKETDEIRWD